MAESSLFRFVRTVRRSWDSEEPYWFWWVGRWQISAGFFKGFALSVCLRRGEWDFSLGPFVIFGVRDEK